MAERPSRGAQTLRGGRMGMIFQEPTTALDVTAQARILELLKEPVDEEAMSLLLIGHDLTVVRATTDRVLAMKAGEIVEHGPSGRVLERPNHAYTKQPIEAAPHIPAGWQA